MEIFTDNYIWIIVIVVVILMTVIGYIAEKTNFGKKEFSKKKTDKKIEEKKEKIVAEKKTPTVSIVETPKVEKAVETFEVPKELVKQVSKEPVKQVPKEMEQTVQFNDPLVDDMNVSNNVLETPYQEPITQEGYPETEDLNAPLVSETSNASYEMSNEPSLNISEDLNAPFGDFEMSTEGMMGEDLNVPLTNEVSYNTSYEMPEEDLNAPFGDHAEIPTREEFNLNLPDIDSIKEDVSTTIDSENDDDIWKF